MHAALEHQLRKAGATPESPPTADQWRALLARVDVTYRQADQDRSTLERAIGLSSAEMQELNARLATERDRLYVSVASMGDGLCLLDAGGRVEMANPAAERLLGTEPGGLNGQDLGDLVSGSWPLEHEKRGPLRVLRDAMRSGGSCRFDDARFRTLKSEWLPVSFVLTAIDTSHSVRGSVLIFHDIRERKAAQDALRESESRFRAIFESAAVGIVRVDVDGKIADCNRAYCEMLRDDRESLVGQSVFARVHPDEVPDARERFERVKRGDESDPHLERRYVLGDGSMVWAMQTTSFVRNRDGVPAFAIGVVENVTARKHLEISLRQAQKLEAVGRLAAGIAHEINTPVQFVGDSVYFLRDTVLDLFKLLERYRAFRQAASLSMPDLAAELVEAETATDIDYLVDRMPKALDRALDGLDRVATIVRGMKEFAHPTQTEKAPTDLNRAIETTLAIARNEYKYVAEIETEFGELPRVTCHVGELNQAFLNIIVNAAHAIGDVVQGTDGKGRIRIRTWRDGDRVVIAVSDSGSGIPEAIRDRIFDPFFTTKEVGRGTGQGLAIARAVVVEKHQGELTFDTEFGRGTTFTIRLPIEPPQSGAQAA
jgi:PAS domain S-box-containing protein